MTLLNLTPANCIQPALDDRIAVFHDVKYMFNNTNIQFPLIVSNHSILFLVSEYHLNVQKQRDPQGNHMNEKPAAEK
jgi:hypothetical protein